MAVVWCPLLPTALNLLVSRDCLSPIGPTSIGQWESRSSPSTRSIESDSRARNRTTSSTSRTNEESTPTTSTTNISTRSQALSAWLAYPLSIMTSIIDFFVLFLLASWLNPLLFVLSPLLSSLDRAWTSPPPFLCLCWWVCHCVLFQYRHTVEPYCSFLLSNILFNWLGASAHAVC